jgi:hypothetical protein
MKEEGSKSLEIETNYVARCAKISICTAYEIINNKMNAW